MKVVCIFALCLIAISMAQGSAVLKKVAGSNSGLGSGSGAAVFATGGGGGANFVIKKADSAKPGFYFVLRAGNNQVILVSEIYTTLQHAQDGVVAVLATAGDIGNYKQKKAADGSPYFVLESPNNKVIGSSEMYKKEGGAINGADACHRAVREIIEKHVASKIPAADQPPLPGNSERIVLKKSKDAQTYFVLQAANNEVVFVSELYTQSAGAVNGIASVLINGGLKQNFKQMTATNGQPYFVLQAQNAKVIGTSEMYQQEKGVKTGIEAIQKIVRTLLSKLYASKLKPAN